MPFGLPKTDKRSLKPALKTMCMITCGSSSLKPDALYVSSTAFAKYSASYWVNVLDDTTHPWYTIVRLENASGDPPGEILRWWKDLKAWIKELFNGHICGGTISDFSCAVAHANNAGAAASSK